MRKFTMGNVRCLRREVEAERIYNYLIKNGWSFTKQVSSADLIIVSTCAFHEASEELSLHTIRELLNEKSKPSELVIIGCLPKINPEKLEELGNFITISPQNLDDLDRIINAKIKFKDVPDPKIISNIPNKIDSKDFKIYPDTYRLKITRGCLGNCSYCAIKLSVGKLESKPLNKIIEEFKEGLDKGYQQFILIGEDTGCYGIDIGTTICSLLKRIFAIEGYYKLIISDFNLQWLIKYYDEVLPIFLKNHNRIEDIILPIQSGSNRILRLMKRPYDIEKVKAILRDLKKKIPQLEIQTHIMVGFPGETTEDFNKSKELLQEFDFSMVDTYRYSDRPNTEASKMQDKIPKEIINERTRELTTLLSKISKMQTRAAIALGRALLPE